jgi:hypothetical protein
MPRISQLAAVVSPPASYPVAHIASQLAATNNNFDVIYANTLQPLTQTDYISFRAWLFTVPF